MDRKNKGRQKVELVKIEKENSLQVTFSKRRAGLFKKASELAILCGAEVAVVVFSPGRKVYSFGHPNVESVVNKFLSGNPPIPQGITDQLIEAHRNASIHELNMQLTHLENLLESERRRGETLDQMKQASQAQSWWRAPIDELNLEQLEQLKAAMQELKVNVKKKTQELMMEVGNPLPYLPPPNPLGGGVVPFDANASGFHGSMMPYGFNHGTGPRFF